MIEERRELLRRWYEHSAFLDDIVRDATRIPDEVRDWAKVSLECADAIVRRDCSSAVTEMFLIQLAGILRELRPWSVQVASRDDDAISREINAKLPKLKARHRPPSEELRRAFEAMADTSKANRRGELVVAIIIPPKYPGEWDR